MFKNECLLCQHNKHLNSLHGLPCGLTACTLPSIVVDNKTTIAPKKQTNFERITASADSLISFILDSEGCTTCRVCKFYGNGRFCERKNGTCSDGIKQWLEQEAEA